QHGFLATVRTPLRSLWTKTATELVGCFTESRYSIRKTFLPATRSFWRNLLQSPRQSLRGCNHPVSGWFYRHPFFSYESDGCSSNDLDPMLQRGEIPRTYSGNRFIGYQRDALLLGDYRC